MDSIEVIEKPVNKRTLEAYSKIPISYEVRSILDVELIDDGLKGIIFKKREVTRPYIKNYDRHERLLHWLEKFDTGNWRILSAVKNNKSIGGLTLAYKTPGVYMLEDRDDLTVVWDIRVLSEYRYQGIGTILFQKAIEWARDKHCTQLKVETQNVNEPACRFYVKQGCKLGGLNRFAYQEDPLTREEVQLLWYLNI